MTIKIPSHKKIVDKLEKHIANIAKERDRLRDEASEFEMIADSCEEAIESIQDAIDKLSEFA